MKKKRVVVALSGGVDSSTAAHLLKKEGHEVIGISMQLYDHSKLEESRFDSCCSLKDVDIARRAAQILDIPFYVLNFEKVFKEKVVDYFTKDYLCGRTPNPCVKCNEDVKFKHLILKAKELKADHLATGHYVRNIYNEKTQTYQLLKAKDRKKDQSYFLFGTSPQELPFLLFPLGELEKTEVRDIAREGLLPNAAKPESMEICFIPNHDYGAFIEKQMKEKDMFQGEIVNKEGEILGTHEGSFHFTVGQRKGLGVSSQDPLYVLNVDPGTKKVTVGSKEDLFSQGLIAQNVHWISRPHKNSLSVKIRHTTSDIECTLEEEWEGGFRLKFHKPQRAVTPGQAAVLYEGDVLLGGGWIEKGTL